MSFLSFFILAIWVVQTQPALAQDKIELRPPIKKKLDSSKPMTTEKNTQTTTGKSTVPDKLFHSDIDSILDGGKRAKEPIKSQVDKISFKVQPEPISVKRGFKGFKVTILNNSNKTIIVNGNSAEATIGGAKVSSSPMRTLASKLPNSDGPRNKLIRTAANSATALATVGAIATIKDQINDMGPVRKRYGYDEARREEELGRFADRVLYPGEGTSGIMYFANRLGRLSSLRVSVSDFDNRKDTAYLQYRAGK